MSDVKPVAWQRFDEIGEYDSYMGSVEEGDYVKYDDALATVTALQAEIEALRKDAERLDWVQRNLLSADFEYEYQPGKTRPVLIIAWPRDVAIGGNARMNFDAAIAKEKQQESLK